ncbi:MAG TPA: ABC transporter permease [Longimicrobiales bacterium]|nr:ABC transporter permease [Longimicrobiales bacterium]
MSRYAARRLLGAVPLVFGVVTLLFFVVHLAPGDPASYLIPPVMSADVVARIRTSFGLDQPVPLRYLKWLGALLTGDLGQSFSHGRPVTAVLAAALPATLVLSGVALVVSFVVGTLVGVIQAVRHHRPLDGTLSVLTLFFYSMPSFWLALMMMLVFSYAAANVWDWPFWFPASGMLGSDHESLSLLGRLRDRAMHLALPAASLSLVMVGGVARFVRGSMLDVVRQDYVRTARAKGVPERRVILGHALRNALIPVVTLLGLYLPILFGGTIFVEEIFAWPGMGRAVVGAIHARDYPLVVGGGLLFAALVVVGNLLSDLLYAVVDPRVRYD